MPKIRNKDLFPEEVALISKMADRDIDDLTDEEYGQFALAKKRIIKFYPIKKAAEAKGLGLDEVKKQIKQVESSTAFNVKKAKKELPPGYKSTRELQKLRDVLDIVDRTDFARFVTGKRVDLTGEQRSINQAMAVGDAVLAKKGYPNCKVLNVDGIYYIKDNKTNDLYALTGTNPNPVAIALDLIPVVPAIAGAVIGGRLGPATGSLGASAGSAIGETGTEMVRQEVARRAGGPSYPVSAPLQAGIGDLATGGAINATIKTGVRAVQGVGKVADIVIKQVPKGSKLAGYVGEKAKALGQGVADTATAIDKKSGNLFSNTGIAFGKIGNAVANANWSIGISSKILHPVAIRLESSTVGSLVLGVPKSKEALNKVLATKVTIDKSKHVLDALHLELAGITKEIRINDARLKGLTAFEKKTTSELTSGVDSQAVGNILSTKLKEEQEVLYNQLDEAIKATLDLEAKRIGLVGYNPEINQQILDTGKRVDLSFQSFKEASETRQNELTKISEGLGLSNKDIDEQIKGLEKGSKDLAEEYQRGLSDEITDLEKEVISNKALTEREKIQIKEQIIDKERELLKITNDLDITATSSVIQGKADIAGQIDKSKAAKLELAELLNQAKDPEEIGQILQDQIIPQWEEGIRTERELYERAAGMADNVTSERAIRVDISKAYEELKEGLGSVGTLVNMKIKDPTKVTPRELLNLKRFTDDQLSGGVQGADYKALARFRGRLVSDKNNVFSRSGSKALETYLEASARRIGRYDALQRNAYSSIIGDAADLTTGKVNRDLLNPTDVYNNFINIAMKDRKGAARILDFGANGSGVKSADSGLKAIEGGSLAVEDFNRISETLLGGVGSETSEQASNAFIKNIYNETGADPDTTLSVLSRLQGDVGETLEKNLFKFLGKPTKAFDLLQAAKTPDVTFSKSAITDPNKIEKIITKGGITEQQAALKKQALNIGKDDSQISLAIKDLEKQKRLRPGQAVGIDKEIERLKKMQLDNEKNMLNIKGQIGNLKTIRESGIAALNVGPEITNIAELKQFSDLSGTPLAQKIKELMDTDPQSAQALLVRAGVTDPEQQRKVITSLYIPRAGVTGEIKAGEVLGGLEKSLQGAGISAETKFANASDDQFAKLRQLKQTQDQIASSNKVKEGLIGQERAKLGEIGKKEKDRLYGSLTASAIGTLGAGAAAVLTPGTAWVDPALMAVSGLAGISGLRHVPQINRAIRGGLQLAGDSTGNVVRGANSLLEFTTNSPTARSAPLAPALDQALVLPQERYNPNQQQIEQRIKQGDILRLQGGVSSSDIEEEQLRKLLQEQLGAF